jgi:acetate---CoA ligase (ADP-forming)
VEKLFCPESVAIIGLSAGPHNIAKLILENLIRWGYKGRIFGVHPGPKETQVDGIRMYGSVAELPVVPDLAVAMIPAKHIPAAVDACGQAGVRRMAIPAGGFNELGGDGQSLAAQTLSKARQYGIRFVGPNCVCVANTQNGLCLPFVPAYLPLKGDMSLIAQSGGVGLMMWNLLTDENVGLAKFASIGNKLDLDEVDFLEYFGRDPETRIIAMYLESITRGRELCDVASRIDKPIIVLKANTTGAGSKAAMSHTAALSNDDAVTDAAFRRANIIRIDDFSQFISMAKAFQLPPMKGRRLMMMSPAGGIAVMLADHCVELGFEFADPGKPFYEGLQKYSNAGVIHFRNPLDMGDIYDANLYAHIFYEAMHSDGVDGAVYVSQWPHMPRGEDVFYKMFHTDLSKEATGTMLSSGKPLGICLFGLAKTISTIKQRIQFPIFDRIDELMLALRRQCEYHVRREQRPELRRLEVRALDQARDWLQSRTGDVGEETLELLEMIGVPAASSRLARTVEEAATAARAVGFPVAVKLVSPDALHKSDVGGVALDLRDESAVRKAFAEVQTNLKRHKPDARFEGVRVARMAPAGVDMFVGGRRDPSFGPVVTFGLGGIFVEVFRDVQNALCPAPRAELEDGIARLRSRALLDGARGQGRGDVNSFLDVIERVSHLMAELPIEELDLNPVRVPLGGSPALALDARMRLSLPEEPLQTAQRRIEKTPT